MSQRRVRDRRRGSVLIIVIWVCLGLVALTLYFANSMSSELRAAENRAADLQAQQAVAAGTRYAALVLKQFATGGTVPRVEDFRCEAMPVGEATFWFIGRDNDQVPGTEPVFGIVDEASKLNLNSVTREMLELLPHPNMTPELADAIFTWRRRSNEDGGGAAGSNYSSLNPPRLNKSAPFESVDELRLVYGMTLDVLFGEDTNRNGVLDPNEDDSERAAPRDDQDGQLLPGIAEHVTVYSRQRNRTSEGERRINVTTLNSSEQTQQRLRSLLNRQLDPGRAATIMGLVSGRQFRSVAEFMLESQMTVEEYDRIYRNLAHSDNNVTGLVNVNTASETVLACIPGIGPENAATLVAYRLNNRGALVSFAWLRDLLTPQAIRAAGRYITDQSYQFSVDVVGVGRNGRGYARAKTVFDMSNGTPRIVYHQDLTAHGWALGANGRTQVRALRERGT